MEERLTNEFRVRFYRWALNDAVREIKEDCPLIRSVRGIAASAFLEFLDSRSEHQRIDLITSLVKRMHPGALELCGDSLGTSDHELIDGYFNALGETRSRYVDQYMFTITKRASKPKLRTLVKQELLGVCGPIARKDSSDLWDHAENVEGWAVFTSIDLGGTARLRYGHYIRESLDSTGNLNGVGFLNLLEWIGITSGTNWDLLCDGEEEDAAKALANICNHFMNALRMLLGGL